MKTSVTTSTPGTDWTSGAMGQGRAVSGCLDPRRASRMARLGGVALVMVLTLGACTTTQQGQAIAGAEGAYIAVSKLERTAMDAGVLSAADKATLKSLDNAAYDLIAEVQKAHKAGVEPSAVDVAVATAAVQAVADFLAKKGVK